MKIKSFFKIAKELWENPRTHAAIVLGFYFLFFGIIVLWIRLGSHESLSNVEQDSYLNMTNYQYEITINEKIPNTAVVVSKLGQETITIQNQVYPIQNGKILIEESRNPFSTWDFNAFQPKNLGTIPKKGTSISVTHYTDGRMQTEYEINCEEWDSTKTGICTFTFLEKKEKMQQIRISSESFAIQITYQK